jgi:tetratricopeptide (TPR) repeat protein
MRARLFLLLILFTVTTSFFWDDEEKQLRQLHQNGESAFGKGEFEVAKGAFEELLGRIIVSARKNPSQKYKVDWATYVDVAMRLAACHEELNEKKEAETVLVQLLAKRPPDEFIPPVKLMKARLSATHESPNEAYIEMSAIAAKLPSSHWSGKDLVFFHALEHSLDVYYDDLMAKAKRFLMAGCYAEAISMYEDILSAIEKGSYPKVKTSDSLIVKKIRFHLAESHFLAADYEKSLSLCGGQEKNNGYANKIDREMLYLSALCYREKKEYEKALECFQNYTHASEMGDLDHYDHALFEIGYYYYQNGQSEKAQRYFENLQQYNCKPSHLAAIYLARIYLDKGELREVEKLLLQVMQTLNTNDPLRYECYYLRGVAAYALSEYAASKDFFENSLATRGTSWWRSSVYHLGWCNLRLADDPLKEERVRLGFFNTAEEYFKLLLDDEAGCLSLAQLYLLQFRHFGAKEPLNKLTALLQLKSDSFSSEGQVQALLLLAEGSLGYAQKEQIYVQATEEKYKRAASYPQAWYCRGLNHFQQGLCDPLHDASFFELATLAFEKAFRLVEKSDHQRAANILKLEAKAHILRNSPITSLALLEKLLTQFEEGVEERVETLYLQGLLASHLTDLSYFPVAEESLKCVINAYPQSEYTDDALYALATLYYRSENYEKAKKTFLKLAMEHPASTYAAEAWFWTAEAAACVGENPRVYRCHTYEDYPTSEQAPEAYFRQFPYTAYLEGSSEALSHLREFSTRFPQSPLQIAVNYLIGIHEERGEKAQAAFEKALSAFAIYQQEGGPPDSTYVYFRYQAVLALASLYLNSNSRKDLEECERLLITLVRDFSQKEHPLASILKQKTPYPPQFEEGEFKLVHCYLKEGKDFSAQKLLIQMLNHYSQAGIQQGRHLCQVWEEQGKLAMRCADYDTALNCFEIAQGCENGLSSDEQKLTLWLLQSDAFRGKKEYDTAMRLLSRVINAETASPLRIKAMYLRAEIYELAARPELAIRQLEATAKKGGEWGHKAQEKLRVRYGLE